MIGTKLAHYKITAHLGSGGMGEVYQATDSKLGRNVAIKILPEAFAADSDRIARLEREARVLASLNHPCIAAIHGLEESGGRKFLVMELVGGETLAKRIARSSLPLDEALTIATQIAHALEAAHDKGVVHRDLKPANIKVRADGQVKVLDFGLARVFAEPDAAVSLSDSPTISSAATNAGVILGTAAYMSPEQVKGLVVDRRTDIYAFGCVLYEMLTGKQTFQGATVSDVLAAVLRAEPDWSQLPVNTPVPIRRLLRNCLQKDRTWRLQNAGDARLEIRDAITEQPAVVGVSPTWRAGKYQGTLPWALAAGFLIAFVSLVFIHFREVPTLQSLTRFSVDLGPEAVAGTRITVAISRDGRRLALIARAANGQEQLAARRLDQANLTLFPGTDGASDPFFSPDGQWIGFFADGMLKKISVEGGAPVTLCAAPNSRGATWGEDGTIIVTFNLGAGLLRVSQSGETPQSITTPRGGIRWPQVLPGGQHVLFTGVLPGDTAYYENGSIQVLSLKTGQLKEVERGGYFARYMATAGQTGELLYVHQGTLYGVAFDPDRLEVRGTPVPLLEDVAGNPDTAAGQFDFSRTGTFIYLSGRSGSWPLTWLDNAGQMKPLLNTPGAYFSPRLSPDGKRLAFSRAHKNIEVYDWERDSTIRLTSTENDTDFPVWTSDGKHIVFAAKTPAGDSSLQWIRSDGAGEPQMLMASKTNLLPYSLSPNDKHLAFAQRPANTDFGLWILPLDVSDPEHPKAGDPESFFPTNMTDSWEPAFSPDGRWIAFRFCCPDGASKVFVRRFPGPGEWEIGPGRHPVWARTGRELYYFNNAENHIMVAAYTAGEDSFSPVKSRIWSGAQILEPNNGFSNLDAAPDGRFVVAPRLEAPVGEKGSVHVTVLLNYLDELRRKMAHK
jgi:serine/threonine-protein kinase